VAEIAGPIHHLFSYDWHFFVLSPSATPIQALTPIRGAFGTTVVVAVAASAVAVLVKRICW
jgi:hypothetical protein